MNICILSSRYPFKDNMVHVFVKKLVDEWAKAGHHCVVISPVSRTKILLKKEINMPYYEKQIVAEGAFVEIYRPRYWHLPSFSVHGVSLTRMSHQSSIEKTMSSINIRFDFIYGHFFSIGVEGWRFSKKHEVPLFVATGESIVNIPPKPCKEFTLESYRKDLYGVIAVSTKNKLEASDKGIIDIKKTKVFPNGTNLEIFNKRNKEECRKLLHLPQDVFILICVGQFIERKGQRRILQALDKLQEKNIKTIFLGKGEDNFEHESILYKGTVPNELLPLYLNASDLFVLPTLKEGCCNAIIEALACGLPIISSDLDFNYDVLDRDNSILVDPNNIEEIANGIELIYNNYEYAQSLSAKALEKGKKLSIEARAYNILEFIKDKIENHNE